MSLLLISVSWLASVLDEENMHIGAYVTSDDDSGIRVGSPRNDPWMDNGLNNLGSYSWYCVSISKDVPT